MIARPILGLLAAFSLLAGPAAAGEDGDGWTQADGDCDDHDPDVHPAALELCNGADDDCDGAVPAREIDADGDGLSPCAGDCDDLRDWVNPLADERCDGLDTDCVDGPGADERDDDGDGWLRCAQDCDDDDSTRHPGADEGCDGLDTDCDGVRSRVEQDADDDLQPPCAGDCDDAAADVTLGGLETCGDGRDNDCDALIDEGCAPLDDDEDEGTGCRARGCGWSLGAPAGATLLPLGPLLWRRRRLDARRALAP